MNAMTIKTQAKEWYTLGRNFLPNLSDPRFAELAGKSHAFVYEIIAPDGKPIALKVDPKIDTAYADLKGRAIAISANYFNPELYVNRFGLDGADDTEALAISMINGSVIHEALHFKYTAKDSTGSLKDDSTRTSAGERAAEKYGIEALTSMVNIVEDIFIEHQVPEGLANWLQAASDILFSQEDLENDWDMTNLQHFIALVCAWKNKANRDHEAFDNLTGEQLGILQSVATKDRVSTPFNWRISRAIDLLNTFELPEGDSSGEGSGDGEGDSKDDSGDGSESGDKGESTDQDGKGKAKSDGEEDSEGDPNESKSGTPSADPNMGSKFAEALEDLDGLTEEEIKAIADEVEYSSDEITSEMSDFEKYGEGWDAISWKKLVEEDIVDAKTHYYSRIKPETKIDFTFLKNLQAIRTANRTPGAARRSGSVMVKSRLTRIATDGKIFAKNDSSRNTLKRIEVVINVDFSGSTSGSVINNELGAAMAMSKTLRAAGIAHSVYGHTSIEGGRTPYLFHIFSYEMQTTNHDWDKRFKLVRGITLSENFDGVVIKALGEKFTGRDASRFLINLSDGTPCAPGYYGTTANDHTRKEIESLRDRGIAVFAISVVESVVSKNDRIYGKGFNVDGSRDTNAQFQRLIERIAQG